ncbi:MAG: hypothetical protein IH874_05645 [Candidatus Dadabacteria bacterium]|nr:hypothetical protein [Candidatus Dadabacteria bacterium]
MQKATYSCLPHDFVEAIAILDDSALHARPLRPAPAILDPSEPVFFVTGL